MDDPTKEHCTVGRLILSAITSLEGYTTDPQGGFDWAVPDEVVLADVTPRSAGPAPPLRTADVRDADRLREVSTRRTRLERSFEG